MVLLLDSISICSEPHIRALWLRPGVQTESSLRKILEPLVRLQGLA